MFIVFNAFSFDEGSSFNALKTLLAEVVVNMAQTRGEVALAVGTEEVEELIGAV